MGRSQFVQKTKSRQWTESHPCLLTASKFAAVILIPYPSLPPDPIHTTTAVSELCSLNRLKDSDGDPARAKFYTLHWLSKNTSASFRPMS